MGWEVKNLLSCQSKHALVGINAKTGNFLPRELQEQKTYFFVNKSAIWNGTPPTCTSDLVFMCGRGLRDHNS